MEIRRGDFVIIRTGQMERCLKQGQWGAGGAAAGVNREPLLVPRETDRRDLSDTWAVEVRPNETTEANQPWHWVLIPAMGLTMGELFFVMEFAEDCAEDEIYESFSPHRHF